MSQPVFGSLDFHGVTAEVSEIRIHVLRGVADTAGGNVSLGRHRITGMAPRPGAPVTVKVFFRVAGGDVGIAAVEWESGRTLRVEPIAPSPGGAARPGGDALPGVGRT
jgi:hypothetical protein